MVSMMTAATSRPLSASSIASRSLKGTWTNSPRTSSERKVLEKRSSPVFTARPECPWYALMMETILRFPVALRADLIASSTASAPPAP